tara:strand:- start:1537 stop:2535 length:999 start_codon:yes stop_codon:yes gene_type:complete
MSANRNLIIKPEAVRSYRKRSGNTQESLAQQVGISIRNMKKIENSGRTRLHTAERIAGAIGANLNILMGKDAPILSNFWLQTAYGNRDFIEPGELFRTDSLMIMHIENEVTRRLTVSLDISGPHVEAEKNSEPSGLFTTLKFISTLNEIEPVTFRFAKMSLVDGEGIFATSLTDFEKDFHESAVNRLLSNTTTFYHSDGEAVGTQAIFRVAVYRSDPKTDSTSWHEVEKITLKDIYHCRYVVHQTVAHYNPFQAFFISWDNPLQVNCYQANGEQLAISIRRQYTNLAGEEKLAPFPRKWRELFNLDHTQDKNLKSEVISLADFDETDQTDLP